MALQTAGWRFDPLSALLGFVAACVLIGLLYRNRARLASLRDAVWAQAGALRRYLVSGAEFRYRQALARSAQHSHLAGRILDLNDVYVPARLLAPAPISDPSDTATPEPDVTFVVPVFADMPEMAALYGVPSLSVEQALASPASLALIGRPGAGKSTILTHMAVRLADEPDLEPYKRTPVLAHLADIELPADLASLRDTAEPLLIAAEARAGLLPGVAEHVHLRLRSGEALLLLDGWDDLPPSHQAEAVKWLKALLTAYPGNRIIATAPATGYRPLVGLGLVATPVAGWTPEDFRALVERWTAAWPAVMARRKRKPAPGEVEPALIAGWLSGGARGRTPLEITLRVWTAMEGDVLGPRPADWLEAYVARLLPSPDGMRALEKAALESLAQERYGLGRDQLREHANLAFATSAAALPMDPSDFLSQAMERGGLLARRSGGRLSFSHPVVAAYLAVAPYAAAGRPEPFLRQSAPAYAPAFPIYSSLADGTPLVAERLNRPADQMCTDLFAVSQWLADAPSNARWRAEVLRRLANLLVAGDKPELLRGRALVALVSARDESVSQFFKKSLESPDVVARTFAALGLGASGDVGLVPLLAARLSEPPRPAQYAAALALGSIGDQAALRALTQALNEGDDWLRRAAAEVLAMHREDGYRLLREALSANDLLTRRAAVYGLGRTPPSEDLLKLLEDVHYNDVQWVVRGAAEEALAQLKSPATAAVQPQPLPEQIGWLVAWAAARGEGVPPGDTGRLVLRRALNDGDDDTRIAAALTLSRLALSEAIPDLQACLRAASADVRDAAFRALFEVAQAAGRRLTATGTAPL
jgi:HEAT repeat protein